ncbi:MAG: sensor histidine kinase [Candidatus Omnitrophota bacterium]
MKSHPENLTIQAKSIKILFLIVMTVTGILFIGLFIYSYSAFQRIKNLKDHDLRIEQLRGTIIHLDEVLTMSARMAAETGDPQWESRYRTFEPQLDQAIKESIEISPSVYKGNDAEMTEQANLKLVNMENRVFELVRQGQLVEARTILSGIRYQNQKKIYTQGMKRQADEIRQHMSETLNTEKSRFRFFSCVFGLLLFLLIVFWATVLKVLTRWQGILIAQNEEIKKTQNHLVHSEKMAAIGQLAAGIAHEINNPIGFVFSNIQMLEEYSQSFVKVVRQVEEINKAYAQRNTNRVEQLLTELAQLEKGTNLKLITDDLGALLTESTQGMERVRKIVLDLRSFAREDSGEKELIQVEKILESILSIVHNEIKYKATLKKEYGQTPPIYCSSQKIGQVFINLIVNAGHAIEKNGDIGIRTFQDKDKICIEISDNGKGIPADKIQKIFDPFYTTKPVGQGTGLGLSISYEIIKKHGGEIKVHSEPNKGSIFTVILPVLAQNNS